MTTDNRTNEPSETQVKLAYLAHLKAPRTRGMDVYGPMRAALVAAGDGIAGAGRALGQLDPHEVPALGGVVGRLGQVLVERCGEDRHPLLALSLIHI